MNTVTIVVGINSYTLTVLEHIKAFISLASECKSSSFIVTSDNGIWIFTVTLPFVNIWTAAFLKNKRRKSNLNNIRKNYHDIIEWASKQKVPYPEILHLKPPSESYEKTESSCTQLGGSPFQIQSKSKFTFEDKQVFSWCFIL